MDNELTKIPITSKALWREAMKYGAFLGLVTVVLELLPKLWHTGAVSSASGGLNVSGALTTTLISMLYFLVKTGICVYLMVFFTKKLVAVYDGICRSHTFRFGMYMALFSAIVTSAYFLIEVKLMDKGAVLDSIRDIMQTQGASQGLSADSMEEMSNTIIGILPVFTLIISMAKCFIIGLIASLIISRSIPGRTRNPFEDRL